MSTTCLSLHRVAYDPDLAGFRAEAQFVDITGIRRRACLWRGPHTAEFGRIARGLREAALRQR